MPEAYKIRKEVVKPNAELNPPVLGLGTLTEIARRSVSIG